MKNLLVVALLLSLTLSNCVHQRTSKAKPPINERVLEIDYDFGGGYPGGSTTLRITSDSSVYFSDWYANGTCELSIKTSNEKWNKLTANLNLAEFDKIPNARAEREKDGLDTRLYIKTSVRTHSLIINLNTVGRYTVADNLFKEVAYQADKMGKHAFLVKIGHGPPKPASIKLHSPY